MRFLKKYSNIDYDVNKTLDKQMLTRSQENMVEILSLLKKISKSKNKKIDEQTDITYMPELESEESAAQIINKQGKSLKILIPNQMLSEVTAKLIN